MHHPTADRPIEHPSGRFQTTCAFLTRLRAAQNAHTAPLHRFMYEHRPAKPRMPGIKNFPFLGPVGVMLSSCTMRRARMFRSGRTRPADGQSNNSETLSPIQSLADYTIDTLESSFRKRQELKAQSSIRKSSPRACAAAPLDAGQARLRLFDTRAVSSKALAVISRPIGGRSFS